MTKQLLTAAAVAALTLLAACGGGKSQNGAAGADSAEVSETTNPDAGKYKETPMAELAGIQLKRIEWAESFNGRQDKASAQAWYAKEEQLRKEEKSLAEGLKGKAFPITASEASGVKVSNGRIGKVNSSPAMCHYWFEADVSDVADGQGLPCFVLDTDCNIIGKSVSKKVSGGTMRIDFEYYSGRDYKEIIEATGKMVRIAVVSPEEYEANAFLDAKAQAEAAKQAGISIGKNGIGPVELGKSAKALPAKVEGLYDKIAYKKEYNEAEDYDETSAIFTLAGKEMFTALYDADNGDKIYLIGVSSPTLKIRVGGTAYGLGTPFGQMLKAPGIKPDTSGYGDAVYGETLIGQDVDGKIASIIIGTR